MLKIIKSIFEYICLYVSMLFPRDNNLIICGAWFGNKYDDNPRYFYEYLINSRKDVTAYWITKNQEIYERLIAEKKNVCLANSFEAKKLALRAKFVCTATGRIDIGEENVKFLGGAYYINFWHGVTFKKVMYDDEYSNMGKGIKSKIKDILEYLPFRNYFVVSTSETISNIYESAFRVRKNQIIQMGQPRNDYFYIEKNNEYKERFKGKKTILYMPTHRNEGKTPIDIDKIFNLEEVEDWCKKNNYIFLIKKHFYHSKEVNKYIEKYNYIIDITNEMTESQHLLDAADILITDYSSCFIDYLLLNRPIIFYNYDLDNYLKSDRKMYFNYDDIAPGKKCKNFNEIQEYLEQLLDGKDMFEGQREKIKNMFYSKIAQQEVSPLIFETLRNIREVKKTDGYITTNKK